MELIRIIRRGAKHTRALVSSCGRQQVVLLPNSNPVFGGCVERKVDPISFGIEFEFGCSTNDWNKILSVIERTGVRVTDRRSSHSYWSPSEWVLTYDSSIRFSRPYSGIEMKTPIMKADTLSNLERSFEEVKRVLTAINNECDCIVNKTCGCHVHFGFRSMNMARAKELYRAYYDWERVFDALVAPSRRNDNSYCYSCTPSREGARYTKLNIASLSSKQTLEFREHQGTLNPRKIIAWVELIRHWLLRSDKIIREHYRPTYFEDGIKYLFEDNTKWGYYFERKECLA